jgi:hypothetical protein
MSELEEDVAQHAIAFNAMAEKIEGDAKAEPAPVETTSPDEPEPQPDAKRAPAPRRRRFGSELTLDD